MGCSDVRVEWVHITNGNHMTGMKARVRGRCELAPHFAQPTPAGLPDSCLTYTSHAFEEHESMISGTLPINPFLLRLCALAASPGWTGAFLEVFPYMLRLLTLFYKPRTRQWKEDSGMVSLDVPTVRSGLKIPPACTGTSLSYLQMMQ